MSVTTLHELGSQDAVIAVDVQRDFCPGGKLPIKGGNAVVPVLDDWIAAAEAAGATIVASRDWHPRDHVSFTTRGGEWPPHCVRGTRGAEFHPGLRLPPDALIVSKGEDADFDQYSAFDRTGLASLLRDRGVTRVWIGGLAQNVCVLATARDAFEEGFETHVIASATRPLDERKGQEALDDLRDAGVDVLGEDARG